MLKYNIYLKLVAALSKHVKYKFKKLDIQNAIFDHYTKKGFNNIVAENSKGSKMLFTVTFNKTRKYKAVRKQFRNFMNQ